MRMIDRIVAQFLFKLVANAVRIDLFRRLFPFPVALPVPQVALLAAEPLADDEELLVRLDGHPRAAAIGHVDSGL